MIDNNYIYIYIIIYNDNHYDVGLSTNLAQIQSDLFKGIFAGKPHMKLRKNNGFL